MMKTILFHSRLHNFNLKWVAVLGLFMVPLMALQASPRDSVRTEMINGKRYIIHQVDPKETLFAISRKYKVTVAEIIENNAKADAGLAVGQELKIPYKPKSPVQKENNTHKVAPKETLFSIAKMYEVSVEELKKWNNLAGNTLSAGQELIVKAPEAKTISSPDYKKLKGVHVVTEKETLFSIAKAYGASLQQLREWNNLTTDEVKTGQPLFVLPPMYLPENTTEPVRQADQPVKQTPVRQEVKISESVIGSEEVHETGVAEVMAGTEGGRKYLALHKTAKVGTIIKVRNEAAQREVFVRITGTLDLPSEAIIKISRSAYDRLGATDSKFKVELIYYK